VIVTAGIISMRGDCYSIAVQQTIWDAMMLISFVMFNVDALFL
jgi:hypothetical protein